MLFHRIDVKTWKRNWAIRSNERSPGDTTRSLISRSWAIRFEQQYYYSKWKEWRKIRGWKVLVMEMEMERGEREEIVMPSLSLSSSRGDPLRLIYSKGMMRHCVMLNAAFMTRSWSSHADFWLRIINQLGRVSLPHLLSSPFPPEIVPARSSCATCPDWHRP